MDAQDIVARLGDNLIAGFSVLVETRTWRLAEDRHARGQRARGDTNALTRQQREGEPIDIILFAEHGFERHRRRDHRVASKLIIVRLIGVETGTGGVDTQQQLILRGCRRQIGSPDHHGPASTGVERQRITIVHGRTGEDTGHIVAGRVVDRQIIIRRSGGQVEAHILADQTVEGIVVLICRIAERRRDRCVETDQRRLAA